MASSRTSSPSSMLPPELHSIVLDFALGPPEHWRGELQKCMQQLLVLCDIHPIGEMHAHGIVQQWWAIKHWGLHLPQAASGVSYAVEAPPS